MGLRGWGVGMIRFDAYMSSEKCVEVFPEICISCACTAEAEDDVSIVRLTGLIRRGESC